MMLVLWKVSYNYIIDIKQVTAAPRIIRILKIIQLFSPDNVDRTAFSRIDRTGLSQVDGASAYRM